MAPSDTNDKPIIIFFKVVPLSSLVHLSLNISVEKPIARGGIIPAPITAAMITSELEASVKTKAFANKYANLLIGPPISIDIIAPSDAPIITTEISGKS